MYCKEEVNRRRNEMVEVKCDKDVIKKGKKKFD